MGSETPRGFNHGPAMGPGVSTTNNFAFISACDKHTAAYSCLCRIQPLSTCLRARAPEILPRTSKLGAGQAPTLGNCAYGI